MTTLLQNKAQVQDSPLLKEGADYGDGLPGILEALRRELREKAKALGIAFREGYAYLR